MKGKYQRTSRSKGFAAGGMVVFSLVVTIALLLAFAVYGGAPSKKRA